MIDETFPCLRELQYISVPRETEDTAVLLKGELESGKQREWSCFHLVVMHECQNLPAPIKTAQ